MEDFNSAYWKFTGGWRPHDVRSSQHGQMICCTCGKKIESGSYQVRQKTKGHDWYYQTQHRCCAKNKKDWDRLDKEKEDENKLNSIAKDIAKEERLNEDDQEVIYRLLSRGYTIEKMKY